MGKDNRGIKEREEQLALAAELSRLITSKSDVGELCGDIAFMLNELMPIDWAAIGIMKNSSGMLHLSPLSPKVNSSWELGDAIQLEGTPVDWLAESKRALVEADLQIESRFWTGTYYLKQGLRSVVCMPLFSQGEVFGSLIIGSKKPKAYGERELRLLKYTATQLALPIENDRLRQQNRHREEQLAVLNELFGIITSSKQIENVFLSFAQRLRKQVDFQRLSIALVEGEALRILAVFSEAETEPKAGAAYPLQDSATAWIIEHRKTSIARDFAQERLFPVDELHLKDGLRSEIRVPLFSRGEVFATMHLTSAKPDAYGEREQDFLERLAAQIAPSIENLILYASQNGEVGLPIAPAHEPETPPTSILTRKELEELGQEVRKLWKMLLTSFIIAHQVGVRAPEASLKVEVALAPKALIIDSDPVLVNQLTSALSQADFEVLSASDCSQGLLKLGEAHPKLVILTETLPDSGQICSQIRKSHDIPIIMLGSDPTEEAWARALSWGADAYFMKSISKPELVSRIRAILRRYQPPPIARTRNED